MSDSSAGIEIALAACAESVGELTGLELEVGPHSCRTTPAPPEGDLAVLPLAWERAGAPGGELAIASPLAALALLARRMLGDENPDKEREPSEEELGAIGEILSALGAGLEEALQSAVDFRLKLEPRAWWRTREPGENAFDEEERLLASGVFGLPDGTSVPLFLRLPSDLLAHAVGEQGPVRLIGFDDAQRTRLSEVLAGAGLQVAEGTLEEGVSDALSRASLLVVAGQGEASLAFCGRVRRDDRTWTRPVVLVLAEPTREDVIRALDAGASHVVRADADAKTTLRVLRQARRGSAGHSGGSATRPLPAEPK